MKNEIKNHKISLYNRNKNTIEEEIVFERWFMDFFYGTRIGIISTHLFIKRKFFTKILGSKKLCTSSKKEILPFIKKYNIDISEIKEPLDSFKTFNDFFIRELKDDARPVNINPGILISPADARLLYYPLNNDTVIPVKGRSFSIHELINNKDIIKEYNNGVCLVFRLAPADYHRFYYIDNGSHEKIFSINGSLNSVSPLSLMNNIKVFSKNYREFTILKTENFGNVIHIDVGALAVGKIVQHYPQGTTFKRNQEKGYFEFGASTIILFFKPGILEIDNDIIEYSKKNIETIVKHGSEIGKIKK